MTTKVLVTAGASGIGLEIVRAFLATGAKVFTCDIDEAALADARREMPELLSSVCDISERAAVEAMVAKAEAALGGIDVLVNNAGIGGPTTPVRDLDPDEWEKVLKVDLNGTFYVTKYAIPHLVQSKSGVIINMSSTAGRMGYPNRSPYATAKWGLIGFTKTLAMELGAQGVRVNAIAPGAVEGARMQRVFEGRAKASGRSLDEIRTAAMASQSLKRFVDPKDVAALAVFLASDAAKSISGQVIPIDADLQRS